MIYRNLFDAQKLVKFLVGPSVYLRSLATPNDHWTVGLFLDETHLDPFPFHNNSSTFPRDSVD